MQVHFFSLLSSIVDTIHIELFKFNQLKLTDIKIQFLGCITHVLSASGVANG